MFFSTAHKYFAIFAFISCFLLLWYLHQCGFFVVIKADPSKWGKYCFVAIDTKATLWAASAKAFQLTRPICRLLDVASGLLVCFGATSCQNGDPNICRFKIAYAHIQACVNQFEKGSEYCM